MRLSRKMLLLLLGGLWGVCSPHRSGADEAFFALRSCHQLLGGDAGEFFSPDYLCSNPPLWCNWTIRVDPRKRVHLDLEDLTPDDVCHDKQDQLHVEDPAGGHKLLLKCWREAKFTSSTNMLEVVLLIGGWPSAPYRGFYARYHAFGPPVVYNPEEEPTGDAPDPEQVEADLMAEEPEREEEEEEETGGLHHPVTSGLVSAPTLLASTWGTAHSGRGTGFSESPPPNQNHELRPPNDSSPGTSGEVLEGARLEEEKDDEDEEEEGGEEEEQQQQQDEEDEESESSAHGQNHSPDRPPLPREEPEPDQEPNVMEPLSDLRGTLPSRNVSESPHLPGDHLFEVAVEVNFSQDLETSWDHVARSLLLSLKTLISDQLKGVHTPLSMSSKRIKRLNAGALFILWVQLQDPGGPGLLRGRVHAALQSLIAADVTGSRSGAVIVSVSTADVDECGTQLLLCDANADCTNVFGSYSCRCRAGFRDGSRLGSGGTVCIELSAGGGLSAEARGVYALSFLLLLLLLGGGGAAGLLYHRHRRGGFQLRRQSSGSAPEANNNNNRDGGGPAERELPPLPPPPPPARGLRESWPRAKEGCPPLELPLLRFSPLLVDGLKEPQERGKI